MYYKSPLAIGNNAGHTPKSMHFNNLLNMLSKLLKKKNNKIWSDPLFDKQVFLINNQCRPLAAGQLGQVHAVPA